MLIPGEVNKVNNFTELGTEGTVDLHIHAIVRNPSNPANNRKTYRNSSTMTDSDNLTSSNEFTKDINQVK